MSESRTQSDAAGSLHQGQTSPPILGGALGGAGAFVLGYLITYLWKAHDYRDALAQIQPLVELFGGEAPPPWKIIGWLFYSAHSVDSRVAVGPVTVYVNLVGQGEGNLEVLYLLPPLLLIAAGYLVAGRTDDLERVVTGVQAGVMVLIGYGVLVLGGVFVFQVSGSGPELVPSVLLAGIVYPLVFGGIGGAVAYFTT